jgi:hypothetical protein
VNQDVAERVRRAIYDTFAGQGRAPSDQQIQELARLGAGQVAEAVADLGRQRHLALDQSGNVVMAHPFTTLNLGFSVMGETTMWWGVRLGQLRNPPPRGGCAERPGRHHLSGLRSAAGLDGHATSWISPRCGTWLWLVRRTAWQPLPAQGPAERRRLLPFRRPARAVLGAQRLTSRRLRSSRPHCHLSPAVR